MKVLPHNFIMHPVTNAVYCSNCGITKEDAKPYTSHCAFFSHAEQVRIMQLKWFERHNERMLERLCDAS
jgi:hypothetical protein